MSNNLHKTLYLNASPETVWEFLTNKDKLAMWFHPAENNLTEGEDYVFYRKTDDGEKIRQIWGKVLTANKPNQLIYTFIVDPFNGNETTVEWQLEAVAGGTKITVQHSGIIEATGNAALPLLMALDTGWDEHFKSLRTTLKVD